MPVLDATSDHRDTPELPDPFELQRQTSRQLAKPAVEGYTIVAFIGEGTYGDVWKAIHKDSGTLDAIKRLHKRPDAQARGEARMLAALAAARGIVKLKKTQLEKEPYCYVMEFMQGGTLGELIDKNGKLPFAPAWEMFRELVDGLRYVHHQGAVHCDIKPDNILLDALGKPRLSDFGQSRGHGPGGASLGTPFYMPPEQARLGLPDPRWDVYALGAVLFQMLTGAKPRHNHELANELSLHSQSSTEVNTRLQKYAAHLDRVPAIGELKDIDPSVMDLLHRCLANDFEARPKDAAEVYSLVTKLERKRRRRSLLLFGGIGPAAALLAVGLFMLVGGWFALNAFEKVWIGQVVDDNQAVASAIAEATKERFNDQLASVESEADHWRDLFVHRSSDPAAFGEQIAAEIQATFGRHKKLDGWHVTDRDGRMVSNFGDVPRHGKQRATFDDRVVGKQYGWRGWFNGKIDQTSEAEQKSLSDEKAYEALQSRDRDLFVSAPYKRRQKDFWVMTISRKLSSDGQPLGVLAGQFRFSGFVDFIKHFESAGGYQQRKVVITNEEGQALYHPALTDSIGELREDDEPLLVAEDENVPVVRPDYPLVRSAFAGGNERDLATYTDPWYPNPGVEYFIGRANVGLGTEHVPSDQKLAVLVFHDKDHALHELKRAKWTALLLGLGLLLIGGLFLVGNIWGLQRTLSREEAVEYA